MDIDRKQQSVIIGVALIIIGGLALLFDLGIFGGDLIGVLLFAGGGAYLYHRVYDGEQGRFWALLVSFALFGLAAAILASGPLSGTYFMGLTGAGFVLAYLNHPRLWWALIPGGALLTLAVVAGLAGLGPSMQIAPGLVLFLGFAGTFGVLYWIGRRWAIYPALALAVIALTILSFSGFSGGWLLPLLLIGGGAYLLSHQGSFPPLNLGRARAKPTDEAEAEPAEEPGDGEAKETA